MKINLRESLNKIDLATDNKYDLLNTFDSKKLSDNSKKKLAEAIDNNSIASINRVLHESEEQLYKVVISSGATKRNFESALYEDEAEGIVDYYGGRWIDENGFEWSMYVEEDDDSTERVYPFDESLNEQKYSSGNYFLTVDETGMGPHYSLYYQHPHSDYDGLLFIVDGYGYDNFKEKLSKFSTVYPNKDVQNLLKNINESKSVSTIGKALLPKKESLKEASYGGAYDIEDDMYFTKEDIVEFADNICEDLAKEFGYKYDIADVYMDSPTKLHIELIDNHDVEVDINVRIDMRRIKKPSDLEKIYHNSTLESFKNRFLEEYQYYEFDESLKESIDISDYEELHYPLRDGDKYYQLYRKIENGKGVWAAAELDKYGSDVVGEPFKITYEQARGFEPIEDSSIRKLSRDLGKKLLPKRENLNEDYRPLAIGYMILKKEIPNHVNYAEFANYDKVVTAIPSEADVVVYPCGGKISGTDKAYWKFDAIDGEGKKTKANFSAYIYLLKDYLNNDEMELKLIPDFKLIDEYPYLIEVDDDIEESLPLKESYIRDIIKLVRDSTNKYSSTYGKFTPARFDSYYINDLFDEFYKNGYSVSYNVLDYSKDYDDLSNQEYWFEKNESLSEDYEDDVDNWQYLDTDQDYKKKKDYFGDIETVDEQLYKIVCKSGASEWPFESALSYEDAQEIVEYYGGRWIDERGFEWSMEIEEDDESTERVYPFDESLNEKLIPAPQEVVDELLAILEKYDFVLDDSLKNSIGKTWSGNTHVQVINKDSYIEETEEPDTYAERLMEYVPDELENEIDALSEREKVRITYNFGINRDWQVTGGLDVWKKHVPGKEESLKEAIDDKIDLDYETDFDDDSVEEGNVFVEGGVEYAWIQRIAGPIYLDFDKWAVWSARVFVDPREFMTIHDNSKGYDFDGDAFKEKAMAAPIVYFVVEEDTGFIDWGPVESRIEAQDFLNGKVEDWENDEYDESLQEGKILDGVKSSANKMLSKHYTKKAMNALGKGNIQKFKKNIDKAITKQEKTKEWGKIQDNIKDASNEFNNSKEKAQNRLKQLNDKSKDESLKESKDLKEWWTVDLSYTDGEDEYDFEVNGEDVIDYITDTMYDNGEYPDFLEGQPDEEIEAWLDDKENYPKFRAWVEEKFDELFKKYEDDILDYFREKAEMEHYAELDDYDNWKLNSWSRYDNGSGMADRDFL